MKVGGREMKPQDISACILRYLKESAESFLGEPVEEAVITVPAYFTNEQRVATKVAWSLMEIAERPRTISRILRRNS